MKRTHNDVFTTSFMNTDFYKEQRVLALKNKQALDEKRAMDEKRKQEEERRNTSVSDIAFPNNICYAKAKAVSVEIISICKKLMEKKDYTILAPICNQIVRSSTSVLANISEGNCKYISAKDKCFKFSLAYKECLETISWECLLYEIGELTEEQHNYLTDESMQIVRILSKSIYNIQNKKKKRNGKK